MRKPEILYSEEQKCRWKESQLRMRVWTLYKNVMWLLELKQDLFMYNEIYFNILPVHNVTRFTKTYLCLRDSEWRIEDTPSSHFFSSLDIMKRIWLGRTLFGINFFKLSLVLQNQIDPEIDEDLIQIIIFYRNLRGTQIGEMFLKHLLTLVLVSQSEINNKAEFLFQWSLNRAQWSIRYLGRWMGSKMSKHLRKLVADDLKSSSWILKSSPQAPFFGLL